MNNTAVIRLSDMTFILMEDEKVLLALSYHKNAVALVSLLKMLDIDNLYLLTEPNIELDTENLNGNIIPSWNIGNVSFSLSDPDVFAIKCFSALSNAKNTFLVNSVFDYGYFSRFPDFHMVKTWKNLYAYLSYENKDLSYIQVNDNIDDLISKKDKVYDEVHIIDVDKVKGRFPELAYRDAIEIAALAPLLYATTNALKVSIDDAFALPKDTDDNVEKEENETSNNEVEESILPEDREEPTFVELSPKDDISKVKPKKKKPILGGILTACIIMFSICIGVSFGTRSFPSYIAALGNELRLITEESNMFNKQEIFYQNQIEKLNGRQITPLNIYSSLKNIPVNGLLGEMRYYSDSIVAVYYLLDANGIDPLVGKIEEKYTVSSVSATDTIKLNDNTVSVFSITLH